LREERKCTNCHHQQQESFELKVQKQLREEKDALITITNNYERLGKKKQVENEEKVEKTSVNHHC
jgi:hypothetical protein